MQQKKWQFHWRSVKGAIIIFIVIILLVGLLSSTLSYYSQHGKTNIANPTDSNRLGIGFVWPEDVNTPPDQRPQTVEIHRNQGEPFTPLLILQSTSTETVLVSVFLDYKQVEFVLDGQKGLLHKVRVSPGVDNNIPMRVDIPGEGEHDLLVTAFSDTSNQSLDINYRSSLDQRMVGRRAVVIVGKNDQPVVDYNKNSITGSLVPEGVHLNLGVAFTTLSNVPGSHPSDMNRQLYVAAAKPDQKFDFGLWASNLGNNRKINYAVMLLVNFHQVPINGKDVALITLDPNHEVTIPTSILLPPEKGVVQMQLVYILDPGKSILRNEVTAPSVFASPRIAIDTAP